MQRRKVRPPQAGKHDIFGALSGHVLGILGSTLCYDGRLCSLRGWRGGAAGHCCPLDGPGCDERRGGTEGGAMRYSFGDYVLDTERQELQHAGAPVRLRRKVFQVLAYLLAHRARVVLKQELLVQLWPDQFVGDEALTSCVRTLRQVLGERGRTPRFLRTVHGQGYRFVAAVVVQEALAVDDAPPTLLRH